MKQKQGSKSGSKSPGSRKSRAKAELVTPLAKPKLGPNSFPMPSSEIQLEEASKLHKKLGRKPFGFLSKERPLYPVTLSYDEILEYELAFKNYDINGDGVISVDELRLLLERVGLRPSEKEIVDMIHAVDGNRDGVLGFSEFIKLMSRHHNPFVTPRDQFESVFRVFDSNNSGNLSRLEFKNTLFSIGQRVSEEELDSLLEDLDRDKDGLISKREFLKVFHIFK